TRTSAVMAMRMRTATGAPGEARVVTSTSAGWSPGDAVGGGFDTSATSDAVPGASASRFGRTPSHEAARRAGAPASRIRGRPRGPRANPAEATSTTIVSAPVFAMRIARRAAPTSVTCAGDAVSATAGRVGPALATAGAAAAQRTAVARAITGRPL